jgi:hypothetical protein
VSTGFDAPNYTQIPNDLMGDPMQDIVGKMAGMPESELKVLLVLLRITLGYHRETRRLSIRKIMKFAGLSSGGAQEGLRLAEEDGLISSNKDGGVTEWTVIINDPRTTEEHEVYYPVAQGVLPSSTPTKKETRKKVKDTALPFPPGSTPSPVTYPDRPGELVRGNQAYEVVGKTEDGQPVPSKKVITPVAIALLDVTGIDHKLNYSWAVREAKDFIRGGYTAAQILVTYGPGGGWWLNDWRGKKGQRPTFRDIRETISELSVPVFRGPNSLKLLQDDDRQGDDHGSV